MTAITVRLPRLDRETRGALTSIFWIPWIKETTMMNTAPDKGTHSPETPTPEEEPRADKRRDDFNRRTKNEPREEERRGSFNRRNGKDRREAEDEDNG